MTERLCEWVFQLGDAWPDDIVNVVLLDGDNEVVSVDLTMNMLLDMLSELPVVKNYFLSILHHKIGVEFDEQTILSGREIMVEVR